MKVLFAVSNESTSQAIIKKYQTEYKQIISYKNVYYFKYSLDHIYGFANLKDYYVSDLDCLKQFKKELNKELKNKNIKDPMLKYPFKILLEKVDSVISVLET